MGLIDEVQRLPSLLNEVHLQIVRGLKHARGKPSAEESGVLLEGFVFMLLRLYRDLKKLAADDLFYWAPAEGAQTEVDFVLVAGDSKVAIEIKSATRIREDHMKGLRAIAALPGLARRLLVSPGAEDARTSDGIEIMSLATFCRKLDEESILAG